jgi:hypothetical protein
MSYVINKGKGFIGLSADKEENKVEDRVEKASVAKKVIIGALVVLDAIMIVGTIYVVL